jgi:TRAP-type mannitol/chloroaromatic compound transport system substrate-binding protein
LGTSATRFARRVTELTGDKLRVKVFGGGELVPALQSFDAVSAGTADIYHAAEYYWQGKSKAFNFFTAVPYGLTAQETYAWINYGGGQQLWDELAADFNLKPFVAASTGVQMGGWLNKEINARDDFKGLKFRMPGIGGEVLRHLGAAVVNLPVAEIFPALQSGAIDGTEWLGPWHDLAFGLYKVAKYYYYPGFHEPGACASIAINKKLWDGFSSEIKLAIQVAIEAEAQIQSAEFTARNQVALKTLINEHRVKLRRYSDELLMELGKISGEVVAEVGNADATTKRVYESFIAFRKNSVTWSKISEQGFLNARLLPFKYA